MGIEIEAKMRLDDVQETEKKLAELGAKFAGDCMETNTFFDTPEGRLKSGDQGLRIRVQHWADGDVVVTITHKGARAHGRLKSRSETEVEVEDARGAAEILGALGYFPVLSFEKKRSRWRLDDCWIELDEVPHLGSYIEIEGPSDEQVLALRDKLGYGDKTLVKSSYIAMLINNITEQSLADCGNMIKFPDDVREKLLSSTRVAAAG